MRVKIDESEYIVNWVHSRIHHSNNHIERKDSATLCRIILPNGKIYTGIARCSKRDNFCKDIGRKVSLTRALKSAGFDKAERRIFWKTYLNNKLMGKLDSLALKIYGREKWH